MKALPSETDFIVVGAGIAGLRASVELASAGRDRYCLAKREVTEIEPQRNTHREASPPRSATTTRSACTWKIPLKAGDGLCHGEQLRRILVEEGPGRIEELIERGTEFDRAGSKIASLARRARTGRDRVLRAHGDTTGEIGRSLYLKGRRAQAHYFRRLSSSLPTCWWATAVVGGVRVRDRVPDKRTSRLCQLGYLLATGERPSFTGDTTNPAVATGDGVAMAYRAGAEISDMEFVQFHPTALFLKNAPRFLLSEALRGEGAYLRNYELKRFMPKYHELGELAPRDVVARANCCTGIAKFKIVPMLLSILICRTSSPTACANASPRFTPRACSTT